VLSSCVALPPPLPNLQVLNLLFCLISLFSLPRELLSVPRTSLTFCALWRFLTLLDRLFASVPFKASVVLAFLAMPLPSLVQLHFCPYRMEQPLLLLSLLALASLTAAQDTTNTINEILGDDVCTQFEMAIEANPTWIEYTVGGTLCLFGLLLCFAGWRLFKFLVAVIGKAHTHTLTRTYVHIHLQDTHPQICTHTHACFHALLHTLSLIPSSHTSSQFTPSPGLCLGAALGYYGTVAVLMFMEAQIDWGEWYYI
jgi:hypothetical protein